MTNITENILSPHISRLSGQDGYFFAGTGEVVGAYLSGKQPKSAGNRFFIWIYLRVQHFKVVYKTLKISQN